MVSTPAGEPDDESDFDLDRREPTMTLARWRRFVDTQPAAFTLLSDQQWMDLDDEQHDAYDENRISYHSEMIVVATSLVRQVARQGRLLTMLNRREISARRMMILSGLQTTGKTTALKQLGRMHELRLRERQPGRMSDRIPVVYVSTPPKGSPRKLAAEFARFLGLPPVKRIYNTTDITDAVCEILIKAKVELVLVDEIHNLNLATAAGEDMSDHLKYFTEHLPATFVYAGIDVPRRLSGVRGAQILGRSVVINTGPIPYGDEWKAMITTLEDALRLHRHKDGTLLRNAKYLHQRTGGMIGSLSHLVRASAQTAILEGQEAITRKLMDTIPVDYIAESDGDTAA
ncbi:ATP-binding protein [Nonomuraea sp. NPDC052116]|uniref:ATP-binding protein n=1 Tax=Nonomuraea sp. NPDC052116 TaxID=3155665 RepID=UPI0034132B68